MSAAVQKATENFIIKGEEIANENPEIRNDMLDAVDEVRKTGKLSMYRCTYRYELDYHPEGSKSIFLSTLLVV